ncbi:hypothetical protein [Xanthocytophaga flava]|uniref:hypothetical protein n=1 Tax=Xanthocytophaga flava TaxID=3048013 RepID=UPI0028D3125B|nr:hypothetical protein [Xanthocytophaga flavus]MDJ1469901.1 hypothetical protein [Xanthocytophaga flavus]
MVQDNDLPPIVIPMANWDTVVRTYSFILKANHGAVIESRFLAAFPTFGQVFIINQSDTIKLNKDSKDFIKRPKLFLGGSWTHSIKD